MTSERVLSAVRQSDRVLCEQVSGWESLAFGVAHHAARFPSLTGANQLRDVWLAEVDGPAAFEQAEAYYRGCGLTCRAWVPAAAQPVDPVEALLVAKGWRRIDVVAMGLSNWDALDSAVNLNVRVLPARAMRKAYRATFARPATQSGQNPEEVIGAAFERLDDARYEGFVAVVEQKAAGRIGYLEVGDIARLTDFFVLPGFRRRGVGGALAAHFLRMARRLLPRVVVASVEAGNGAGRAFLGRRGFSTAGTLTEFRRPVE